MQEGTVKWFNEKKGFGFISSQGKEYFAHFKEIQESGFKNLIEGEQVLFDPQNALKGPVAKNITKKK